MNDRPLTAESQCARILEHLLAGNTLTGLEALNKFGTICLPRRIKDLKADGHQIDKNMVEVTAPDGTKKRVAAYFSLAFLETMK